jgi:UDP-glucose 4-epimerase
MIMSKILVTGGLGFIGSHLVDTLLLRDKHEIFVIDNHLSESSYFEYKNPAVKKYIIDDVQNISQWDHILGDFDVIFHLGANARIQPSFENPLATIRNNIIGTASVCEYARHHAKKVVYAGSSSFYAGVKLNPYAFSKWVGEEICDLYYEIYGLPYVIARFFNVYGIRQPIEGKFATVIGIFEREAALGNPLPIVGSGEQRRDFTSVVDICNGLYDLWQAPIVGTYNLGTGKNYSINEIADLFIKSSPKLLTKK